MKFPRSNNPRDLLIPRCVGNHGYCCIFLCPQTLNVGAEVSLCDCPGLVYPSFVSTKAEMVVNGILPIDQLRDHIPPVALISST